MNTDLDSGGFAAAGVFEMRMFAWLRSGWVRVGLLITGLLAGLVWVYFRDVPLEDDSDLIFEESGSFDWREVLMRVDVSALYDEADDDVMEMFAGELNWDEEDVQAYFDRRSVLAPLIEELCAVDVKDWEKRMLTAEEFYFAGTHSGQAAVMYLGHQTEALLNKGEFTKIPERLRKMSHLSEGLLHSSASLFEGLVGVTCYVITFDRYVRCMLHPEFSKNKRVVEDLVRLKKFILDECVSYSQIGEYHVYKDLLNDEELQDKIANQMASATLFSQSKWQVKLSFLLMKPNVMCNLRAQWLRLLKQEYPKPVKDWSPILAADPDSLSWWDMIQPTGVSIKTEWTTYPAFLAVAKRFKHVECSQSLAEILRAVRLHEFEHNVRPPSLEALVPKYLDQIPNDPFTGELLQYDAKLGVIYSAGENVLKTVPDLEDRDDRQQNSYRGPNDRPMIWLDPLPKKEAKEENRQRKIVPPKR